MYTANPAKCRIDPAQPRCSVCRVEDRSRLASGWHRGRRATCGAGCLDLPPTSAPCLPSLATLACRRVAIFHLVGQPASARVMFSELQQLHVIQHVALPPPSREGLQHFQLSSSPFSPSHPHTTILHLPSPLRTYDVDLESTVTESCTFSLTYHTSLFP